MLSPFSSLSSHFQHPGLNLDAILILPLLTHSTYPINSLEKITLKLLNNLETANRTCHFSVMIRCDTQEKPVQGSTLHSYTQSFVTTEQKGNHTPKSKQFEFPSSQLEVSLRDAYGATALKSTLIA